MIKLRIWLLFLLENWSFPNYGKYNGTYIKTGCTTLKCIVQFESVRELCELIQITARFKP
jgi:uncharacterized membrane protein YukC